MVKTTGPCLSLDASGSLAKTLEFRRSGGHNVLSRMHKPGSRSPIISTQTILNNRIYTAEAVAKWHELTDAERALWNEYINQ